MDSKDKIFKKLLTEYLYGDISDIDREELFMMISENKSYQEQYDEESQLNALLYIPRAEAKKNAEYEKLKVQLGIRETNKRKRLNLILMGAVASIALLFITSVLSISIYKHNHKADLAQYINITTPNGGQTKINLPDGSVAWLNAKSSIRYKTDFGLTNRDIELDGEAYFEVEKNKEQAFTVNTSKLKVVAIGTAFNVHSYQEDTNQKVQLLNGCVNILTPESEFKLEPGQELKYDAQAKTSQVGVFETDRAANWTKGKLSFDNTSLKDIIKELERYYNRKINIKSRYIDHEYYMGSISLNMDLYDILNYLDVDKKFIIEKHETHFTIRDRK